MKSKIWGLSLLIAGLIGSTSALAVDTPATLAGAEVVNAAKVKSLQDAGAKIIDTRVKNEYAEAHIKGAMHVIYKEKSAKDASFNSAEDDAADFLQRLSGVAKKSDKIIMQCNGASCWRSYKAAAVAKKDGYASVFWFRGGFPEWQAAGYAVE